jgi:hypothetical protein
VIEDLGRNGDALDHAHHVSELEVDEPDAFCFDEGVDFFRRRGFANEHGSIKLSHSHLSPG